LKQKNVFLEGEGDAWFARNATGLARLKLPDDDPLILEILGFRGHLVPASGVKVLEVGCGPGTRLAWLKDQLGLECHGVEPSAKAVELAANCGIKAQLGTADSLPYEKHYFDIVIFGFCLYLCDREDLFRIAAESDRVLKSPGWLLIRDFYSPTPSAREYHHKPGVYSYKMDYRTLFTWSANYTVYSHRVTHHEAGGYTDDPQEWVATSVLRKGRWP
jgi:ubiquinone/menaquinone biosynthesis C-methylase UbiE